MIQHDADELKNEGPKPSIRDTHLQTSGGPSSAFKCTKHTTPTFNMQKHKALLQIENKNKIKSNNKKTPQKYKTHRANSLLSMRGKCPRLCEELANPSLQMMPDKGHNQAMESALGSGQNSGCYADDAWQGKYWGNGICTLGRNSGCYADDAWQGKYWGNGICTLGRNSGCYADDAWWEWGKYWGNGTCKFGRNSGCYADDAWQGKYWGKGICTR